MQPRVVFTSIADIVIGIFRQEIDPATDLDNALFLPDVPRSTVIGRTWQGPHAAVFETVIAKLVAAENQGRVSWSATEARPYATRTGLRNLLVANGFPEAARIAENLCEGRERKPMELSNSDIASLAKHYGLNIAPFVLAAEPNLAA